MAFKISSLHHSGRLRPHEQTSYGILAILVVIVGIVLASFTVSTHALASPGPQAGSIGLTGTMPEKPPVTAATITTPSNAQQFANTPITVSGSCPINTLIEIFSNNIFIGSTPCSSNNTYTIQVDLLYGSNSLTATDYDVLNQAGPTSNKVNVIYTAQAPLTASLQNINFNGTQLLLNTSAVYRGAFPGQKINVPISIIGGVGPFALNVEWGDNTNQVLSSSNNSTVNATHAYSQPGTYKITIQASDSQGRVAFLDVAAIINGQSISLASTSPKSPTDTFLILWPLYAISATLVVGFWLGEMREKHILANVYSSVPNLTHSNNP